MKVRQLQGKRTGYGWPEPRRLIYSLRISTDLAMVYDQSQVVNSDEPMSALGVSMQAAVTQLLLVIQRRSSTAMVLISHNLSIVRHLADRVVVMYLDCIVEQGTTDQVLCARMIPMRSAPSCGSCRRHPLFQRPRHS